ncbi:MULTISPECIES: CoA transferase [unclassified Frankia]|uniref:CaiB/BaiF CoA transferase family protein n=1 Tax=unclassified Frankia TaxID=2632575 RepID=UPI002AD46514|nr:MULTISPECIES: CoA transferase [unclassified Frankia]
MTTCCDGLVVIELGSGSIAGALCGMLLADNGARVLKVEPPEGDRLRREMPSGFLVWCRGKESVVIDLRTEAGRDELIELTQGADVVIDGFAPGVTARWGIDDDVLRARNPRLVHCSITAFGRCGSYASIKGYEAAVAAKAGLFTPGIYTGRPAGDDPMFVAAPLASVGAGHLACSGVLAALTARETTGRGQHLDATLLQGLTPADYFGTMHWQVRLQQASEPDRPRAAPPARPPALLCSKDGRWINASTTMQHQLRALVAALEITVARPSSADAVATDRYRAAFYDAFRRRTMDEWVPILLADPNIAFEVVRTGDEAMEHPQALHNGQIVEVLDPVVGPIAEIGPIASFSATPSRIGRSAPALGEHAAVAPPAVAPPAVTVGRAGAALPHPLAGITIVELGYFYAMPFALTMAASFGARVIKIEALTGDPMRVNYGIPEAGAVKVLEGKESVAVDLKSAQGRAIIERLLARADVFAFGFRPKVATSLGLDYETVRRLNPRIVYLHASGYGVDGPYSERPLYAGPASATSGAYHRQAGYWLAPERAAGAGVEELRQLASRVQPPVDGDSNAALAVLSALSLALLHQRRSGVGQFVATSMIEGNAYAYADDYVRYEGKPPIQGPDPDQRGLHALYRLYPAASGWIMVAAPTQTEWELLTTALGRSDLVSDARFSSAGTRADHDHDLVEELTECFATRRSTEWEELLGRHGLCVVEVFEGSMADFTNTDSVLVETGLVTHVEHPLFGTILRHAAPVAFSDMPGRVAPSPLLGEHTDAVLAELGYSNDDIAELKENAVVLRESAALSAVL